MNQQWGPKVEDCEIGSDLLDRWALHYLGRYASSAENLRRVLTRRVRRRAPEAVPAAAELIDALVLRYRESGLLDDAAYAAARVQSLHRRGESMRTMRARLAAKGVPAADVADAVSGLRAVAPDPDLGAACAFARRRRLGPFRRADAEQVSASSARLRERASAAGWPRRCSLAPMSRPSRRWRAKRWSEGSSEPVPRCSVRPPFIAPHSAESVSSH